MQLLEKLLLLLCYCLLYDLLSKLFRNVWYGELLFYIWYYYFLLLDWLSFFIILVEIIHFYFRNWLYLLLLHRLISFILSFFDSYIWFIIFILWLIWYKINLLFLFIWLWVCVLFCLLLIFYLCFWSDHLITAWLFRSIPTISERVIYWFKAIIVGNGKILLIVIIVLLNKINIF